MSKLPVLNYKEIIKILQKNGWVVVRQKGSHIRLQKHLQAETMKLTIPAHSPLKKGTLARIIKAARLDPKQFK